MLQGSLATVQIYLISMLQGSLATVQIDIWRGSMLHLDIWRINAAGYKYISGDQL